MDKNQRKNTRRRQLTLTHQRALFIAGYTQALHPDIYNKADQMYEELKEFYPDKRDVRKTPQFLSLTTGTKSLNSYYYKKKMLKKTRQEKLDTMVLEIPLTRINNPSTLELTSINNPDETNPSTLELTSINNPDETNPSTLELTSINNPDETNPSTLELTSINNPDETNPSTLELTSINNPDETNPSTLELTSINNPDETNPSTGELTTSDIIPDHIYKHILSELTKDPDLTKILNDFESLEEDDIIIDYQNFDEPTPLEWELHNLSY